MGESAGSVLRGQMCWRGAVDVLLTRGTFAFSISLAAPRRARCVHCTRCGDCGDVAGESSPVGGKMVFQITGTCMESKTHFKLRFLAYSGEL